MITNLFEIEMIQMIYILIEIIIICVFFTFVVIIGTKKNPLNGLHNLPLKIQQRVASLPQYQDIKILSTKERIIKKLPALFIVLFIFLGLVVLAEAKSFQEGFLYAFIIWFIVKLYVVIVLNCFWYAHHSQYWIKGTEDLKAEYQNYKFYFQSIPRSLVAGCIVSLLIGLIILFINKI